MKRYIKSASYNKNFERGPGYDKLSDMLDDIAVWAKGKGGELFFENAPDGFFVKGPFIKHYVDEYGTEYGFYDMLYDYCEDTGKNYNKYKVLIKSYNVSGTGSIIVKPGKGLNSSRQIKSSKYKWAPRHIHKEDVEIYFNLLNNLRTVSPTDATYELPIDYYGYLAKFCEAFNMDSEGKDLNEWYLKTTPSVIGVDDYFEVDADTIDSITTAMEDYLTDGMVNGISIESSRRISSARYIATDPESGEVLGSADTYEEAVNEWGEDVTITDSEVGDEMDTTQGGILSSWDNDTPRGEGWLAHDDGRQKSECPYEIGTVEYEDWIDGWEAAYDEIHGMGIGSSKESNHQFNQRIVNSVLTKEITEDDAIKQIASRNNMNIGFAKRIFNNLMEDKSLIQSGVMEMADDINKDFDLNGDLYSWFDDYVEDDGKSTTVGGELVRAAHRIIERYENDGDKIGMGYGKETVNPAARYILAICNDYIDRNDIEEMLYNESRINYSDDDYEAWLQQFQRTFEDYLRNHEELFHAPNKNDIWDYKEDDDVDSSVTECCIYDDDGNEYWFQKDDFGWKCTNVEMVGQGPEYNVDDTFTSGDEFESEIGDRREPYGSFTKDGFTYSWEGVGEPDDEDEYREWIITDVSLEDSLANVGETWEADDLGQYTVYDANGREINVSDLY